MHEIFSTWTLYTVYLSKALLHVEYKISTFLGEKWGWGWGSLKVPFECDRICGTLMLVHERFHLFILFVHSFCKLSAGENILIQIQKFSCLCFSKSSSKEKEEKDRRYYKRKGREIEERKGGKGKGKTGKP